jgi:hypothetical protein
MVFCNQQFLPSEENDLCFVKENVVLANSEKGLEVSPFEIMWEAKHD